MYGSIRPVAVSPPPPRLFPGQVQPFEPGVGNCLKWSRPGGRRGGANKKYLLISSVCEVRVISRAVYMTRWLRTSRLLIFKEKRRNLSESGWRGITYQN